jgi:hypothetical protein
MRLDKELLQVGFMHSGRRRKSANHRPFSRDAGRSKVDLEQIVQSRAELRIRCSACVCP